jgi:integrase
VPRGSRRREAVGFNWDAKRGVAHCNVYLKGGGGKTRKRITIPAVSRDEALEKWIAFRKKWRHVSPDHAKTPTLREFVDTYFPEITAGLKPATVRDYFYTLRGRILPEFGNIKLDEITSGRVNLFVKRLQQAPLKRNPKRSLSPATVNATIDVLKLVISKAVRWDVLDESPFRKPIEHVKVVAPTLELSQAECDAFVAAFDNERGFQAYLERHMPRGNLRDLRKRGDAFGGRRKHGAGIRPGSLAAKAYFTRFRWMKPYFVALLELGLRREDARLLRWREVDFDAGLVHLTTRKRDVEVVLPISKRCREALLECRHRSVLSEFVFTTETGQPVGDARLRRVFGIAKKIAGIRRRCRIHDLRHTYASHLVTRGVSLAIVANLLAHADQRTTMRYARAEKLAAAEIARIALDGDTLSVTSR